MCKGQASGSISEYVGGATNGDVVVREGKEMTSEEDELTLPEVQEIDEEAEEDAAEGEELLVDPLVLYSLRMAALQDDFLEDDATDNIVEGAEETRTQSKKEKKTSSPPSQLIESTIPEPVRFKDGKFNKESLEKINPKETKATAVPQVSHAPVLGRRFKQARKPIAGERLKLVSATEDVKSTAAPAVPPAETPKQSISKEESCKQARPNNTDARSASTAPSGNEPIFFSGPATSSAIQQALYREHDLDTGKLCRFCRLPVGDSCYFHESARAWVHGECYAQLMVQDYMENDEKRLRDEADLKRARRNEYDIGWKVEHIPCNIEPALQLGCALVPQGLCCLVMQKDLQSVCVVPTIEPAAALNLEYLSTALKVRRKDGREPLFSLDPIDVFDHEANDKSAMQMKRFEPEWLATTRAGEVLFQSDYHLKELSMGEYNQPVVGMKSAFEYASSKRDLEDEWSAREWFLVRDAKIQMSDDNVVVPYVRMGVEAREQLMKGNVMVDAPITRKDHPMVKYAEAFTRNFDLIAERKSVVHSLRELAKASVLAKFLLDNQIKLEDTWYTLADESQDCCSLEIPQLWNERVLARVQMTDGEIDFDDVCPTMKGVYGGVEFGLERFTLTAEDKPRVAAKLGGTMKMASGLPSVGKARIAMQEGAPAPRISVRAPGAPGAPAAVSVAASQIPASVMQMLSAAAVSAPRRVAPTRVRAAGPTQLRKMAPLDKAVPPARMALPLGLSTTSTVSTVSTTSTVPPIAQRGVTPLIATGTVSTVSTAPSFSLSGAPLIAKTAGPSGTVTLSALGAPRPGAYSTVAPRAPNVELAGAGPGAALSGAAPAAAFSAVSAPAASVGSLTSPISARNLMPARFRTMTAGMALQSSLSAGPQGVDLNLDHFNLTEAEMMEDEGAFLSQETSFSIGASFFSGMGIEKGGTSCFKEEDAELLRAIFNPNLSDRREEGECFVPPDTRASYVKKLRNLVEQEQEVRAKRKEVFLGTSFVVGDAGPLFPASWTSNFEISSRKAEKGLSAAPGPLYPRSDYADKANQIMKSAKAMFDKTTEDGMRFRIYRVGSVEVRTTQMHEESEVVGAVFSIHDHKSIAGDQKQPAQASERIEKVTEYVERSVISGEHAFYVVIETENGNVVLSEKVGSKMTWEENLADLSDRNSLAKVIRTGDCRNSNTTIADVKMERVRLMTGAQAQIAGWNGSRLYAQDMFIMAMGGISKVEDAYLQKEFDARNEQMLRKF